MNNLIRTLVLTVGILFAGLSNASNVVTPNACYDNIESEEFLYGSIYVYNPSYYAASVYIDGYYVGYLYGYHHNYYGASRGRHRVKLVYADGTYNTFRCWVN